jgi:hypothetical protein
MLVRAPRARSSNALPVTFARNALPVTFARNALSVTFARKDVTPSLSHRLRVSRRVAGRRTGTTRTGSDARNPSQF